MIIIVNLHGTCTNLIGIVHVQSGVNVYIHDRYNVSAKSETEPTDPSGELGRNDPLIKILNHTNCSFRTRGDALWLFLQLCPEGFKTKHPFKRHCYLFVWICLIIFQDVCYFLKLLAIIKYILKKISATMAWLCDEVLIGLSLWTSLLQVSNDTYCGVQPTPFRRPSPALYRLDALKLSLEMVPSSRPKGSKHSIPGICNNQYNVLGIVEQYWLKKTMFCQQTSMRRLLERYRTTLNLKSSSKNIII